MKRVDRKKPKFELNWLDRAIATVAPIQAAKRMQARMAMSLYQSAGRGGYGGASLSRRSMSDWSTFGNDPDSDILPNIETLRGRSRDLARNNPIATGALETKTVNVIGSGLKLQSRIDRGVFPAMSEEQADALQDQIEREWSLFWDTVNVDAARTLTGNELAQMAYRQKNLNGDVFIILPRMKSPRTPYQLKIQLVEADRVCNKDNQADDDDYKGTGKTLAGGIVKDKYGAPTEYHVLKAHPGALRLGSATNTWQVIPAFGGEMGMPNVIHLFQPDRPGQSRGVPDLSAVIEPLKQLDRYTEAELMAAVISGMFSVFVKTETGEGLNLGDLYDETGGKESDSDLKLGYGEIVDLAEGESIETANPGRPNMAFDPFVMAILRQVGMALQLPYEVLIKHYSSSYTAARASIQEAWKYFVIERSFMAAKMMQPIYEIWLHEAVSIGRIRAPGFFADPLITKAYVGAVWVGPAKGFINETAEVTAAGKRVDMGLSTLAEETAALTGGDVDRNHAQLVKEHRRRVADGLIPDSNAKIGADIGADNGDN